MLAGLFQAATLVRCSRDCKLNEQSLNQWTKFESVPNQSSYIVEWSSAVIYQILPLPDII